MSTGKSVGVVTNTRITHATPGAAYAFTPERDWEGDVDMTEASGNCSDISRQLIDDNPDINVREYTSRKHLRTKVTPHFHLTYSKKGEIWGRNQNDKK